MPTSFEERLARIEAGRKGGADGGPARRDAAAPVSAPGPGRPATARGPRRSGPALAGLLSAALGLAAIGVLGFFAAERLFGSDGSAAAAVTITRGEGLQGSFIRQSLGQAETDRLMSDPGLTRQIREQGLTDSAATRLILSH